MPCSVFPVKWNRCSTQPIVLVCARDWVESASGCSGFDPSPPYIVYALQIAPPCCQSMNDCPQFLVTCDPIHCCVGQSLAFKGDWPSNLSEHCTDLDRCTTDDLHFKGFGEIRHGQHWCMSKRIFTAYFTPSSALRHVGVHLHV